MNRKKVYVMVRFAHNYDFFDPSVQTYSCLSFTPLPLAHVVASLKGERINVISP